MHNRKYLKPKSLYIETTNHCNAHCPMCPHDQMKRKRGIMTWSLFEKIIMNCKDLNLEETTIYLHKEGEPLLDPTIFDKVRYIKRELPNLKKLVLNTNAMLLTEENAIKLLESGLDTVFFSVDGASKESYKKLRKGLEYKIVVKNLKHFFEIKGQYNSPVHSVMQMLIYNDNADEAIAYREQWQDLADELFFKEMHNYLDAGMSEMTEVTSDKQQNICHEPYENMVIYWNGDVGICCWDYDGFANVGNLRDASIIEVFNNSKYKIIRQKMAGYKAREIEPCSRCLRVFGQDKIAGYSSHDMEINR